MYANNRETKSEITFPQDSIQQWQVEASIDGIFSSSTWMWASTSQAQRFFLIKLHMQIYFNYNAN
jgi:hypothetical protein